MTASSAETSFHFHLAETSAGEPTSAIKRQQRNADLDVRHISQGRKEIIREPSVNLFFVSMVVPQQHSQGVPQWSGKVLRLDFSSGKSDILCQEPLLLMQFPA
jgi:hypothetical protein